MKNANFSTKAIRGSLYKTGKLEKTYALFEISSKRA
jgi:hypothetical protein